MAIRAEMSDGDREFAERLRESRTRAGLTQEDLTAAMNARGFDFAPQTVYKIEKAMRRVSVGEAVALAKVLGMTLDALMTGAEVRLKSAMVTVDRTHDAYYAVLKNHVYALLDLVAEADRAESLSDAEREWLDKGMRRYTPGALSYEAGMILDAAISRDNIPPGDYVDRLRKWIDGESSTIWSRVQEDETEALRNYLDMSRDAAAKMIETTRALAEAEGTKREEFVRLLWGGDGEHKAEG